jgi:hypothetical protein
MPFSKRWALRAFYGQRVIGFRLQKPADLAARFFARAIAAAAELLSS